MAKSPKSEPVAKTPLPKSLVDVLPSALECFKHLKAAQALLDGEVAQQLATARVNGAIELAKAYVVLHRLKEGLDDVAKTFSSVYEIYKTNIVPFVFEDEKLVNAPLSEGYRVATNVAIRASIVPDKKPEAFGWLRDNKMGALIVESVNASSLSVDIGYLIKERNLEPPAELINVHYAVSTTVTSTPNNGK